MKWFRKSPKGPGVHNPAVLDLVTATEDAVVLIMVASGEWLTLVGRFSPSRRRSKRMRTWPYRERSGSSFRIRGENRSSFSSQIDMCQLGWRLAVPVHLGDDHMTGRLEDSEHLAEHDERVFEMVQ